MDVMQILGLVEKGMGIISTLITVGEDAMPAVNVVKDLVTGAKAGTVTPDQLTATETQLDALISDFNKPI